MPLVPSPAPTLISQQGAGIDATHIAYFFVPLPEPLGFPDRYTVECSIPAPVAWFLAREEQGQHRAERRFVASLRFHRAELDGGVVREVDLLFQVATTALKLPKPKRLNATQKVPTSDRTVVEMAVPVRLPETARDREPPGEGSEIEELSDAFDEGVACIRDIQRAYFLARRRPISLISRERLPHMIPFLLRSISEVAKPPSRDEVGLFMLNMNLWQGVRDADFESSDFETFSAAMAAQGQGVLAARYLEFVREGEVALDLNGDPRASVILFATASEVLLDEVLAHVLWETAMRPEEAAAVFDAHPGLVQRVKSQYHQRLGGDWSVDSTGAVAGWFIHVSSLRNRVVHSGYEPTTIEARTARSSAGALQEYIADRLSLRLATLPRTALATAGRAGLESRGRWSRTLQDLARDPTEVPWQATFGRWRAAMQRSRRDSYAYQAPSDGEALVVTVLRRDGRKQFVAHDPRAGMAAVVSERELDKVTPEQMAGVEQHIEALRKGGSHADVSIVLRGASVRPSRNRTWVHEYRLLPLHTVMVTGDALDPIYAE
ncbi:hypothetical protein [Nocardioides caldifontis]|uniref:hypothetical protein n=1 Tax=Nocardioides caldifontis TaxID=2588938 RepID=UPI0011E0075E|nr:hypothetical protein [Nocardioides caldifontis]